MTAEWRLRPHDRVQVEALSRASGLHPLVAHLLVNRGVTDAAAALVYLKARRDSLHDPEHMPGVIEAADRIVAAIRARKKIVVYGDYDVDGACGTSVLWTCLKLAGAVDPEYYIPHRIDEGYGLNAEALAMLVRERKADLIVTVDCGVTAVAEAALARELGVELIVTDHHTPGVEWPSASVVVHPLARCANGAYPFPHLCGAAVAFKLAWQICKTFGDGKKASPHLREFLLRSFNLVAMATVADVMPLEGENRVFVRHGLRAIVADDASVGLKALLSVSGMLGKDRLSSANIGFGLGPRINAAGRMSDARAAVRLLTTDDANEAMDLAKSLDDCNTQRREVERTIASEARALIERSGGLGDRGAIVVGAKGWHPGVIGIVASRLVEIYHRPSIVVALTDEFGQGSARSVPGFNLHTALHSCEDMLLAFGGHAMAAGLKLSAGRFSEFAERFDHHCRGALGPELRRRALDIDAEVPIGTLTTKLVDQLAEMEPFGQGNPPPMLLAERVHVLGEPKTMGEGNVHMKWKLGQGDAVVEAVGWNMAARIGELRPGIPCAVVFRPEINEWGGRRKVQLNVRDFRVAEVAEAAKAKGA